jgi:hypothetical protein
VRKEYVAKGILAERSGELPDRGALLGRISETHRRDEVWMPTATGHLASIMESMDFAAAF